MLVCRECGHETPGNAACCENCGARLSAPDSGGNMTAREGDRADSREGAGPPETAAPRPETAPRHTVGQQGDAESLNNEGWQLLHRGEYEEAVEVLARAVKADPTFHHAYRNRAEAYRHLGRTDLADADIAAARRLEVASHYEVTGDRIVAALIDIVVLAIVFVLMAASLGDLSTEDGFEMGLSGGPFVLYLFLCLGYYVIFEGIAARTLGKLIMGLEVVKLDGKPYDWRAVLVRNILRVIDGLPIFYIVGLVCVAVTKQNQRLGDLAAHTVVGRTRAMTAARRV